jgi:hypothetical protein
MTPLSIKKLPQKICLQFGAGPPDLQNFGINNEAKSITKV